jgi:hypothetical protein
MNHKRFNEIRDNELPLAQGRKPIKKDFAGQIAIDFDSGEEGGGHQQSGLLVKMPKSPTFNGP